MNVMKIFDKYQLKKDVETGWLPCTGPWKTLYESDIQKVFDTCFRVGLWLERECFMVD